MDKNDMMSNPFLLYCTKLWLPNRITSRIQSAETTFFRDTIGCTKLDHIRNEDIRNQLQIYSIYKILLTTN